MTTANLPCFHAHVLRSTFERQLTLARANDELSPQACDSLLQLCLLPWQPAADLRIDRLDASDWKSPESADALMISHVDPAVLTVYLSLPLRAVERFEDRHSLNIALQARYGNGDSTDISAEQLATSPFDYWMSALLSRQQRCVEHLDDILLKLPSLRSVLHSAVQADIAHLTVDGDSEPGHWAWHVSLVTDPAVNLQTRSLMDVAIDEFCAVPLRDDQHMTLLDARGTVLSAEQQQLHTQSISRSINRLNATYEQAIDAFWKLTDDASNTYADDATRALAHLYYLALLRAEQEGRVAPDDLTWLRNALRPSGVHAPLKVQYIRLHSGQRAEIPVAGAMVLSHGGAPGRGCYFFSARSGLQHFPQPHAVSALCAWLTNADQGVLLQEAIGMANHAPYQSMKRIDLGLVNVAGDIFADRVNSMIAVQRTNLGIAIAQRGEVPEEVATRLDDAVDVRGLLAPSLLSLPRSARWAAERSGARLDPDPDMPPTPAYDYAQLKVGDLQAWSALMQATQPGLGSCVQYIVDRQLALMGLPELHCADLQVTRVSTQSPPQPLLNCALEQLGATPPAPFNEECVISTVEGETVTSLDARLLNHVMTRVARGAHFSWVRQFDHYHRYPQRIRDSQIDTHNQLLTMRQQVLRAELELATTDAPDSLWIQTWLRQVLDRPTRAMRLALGDEQVEVNRVNIRLPGVEFAIPISNVMALTLAREPTGQVLFCSHLAGVMTFADRAQFTTEMDRLMRDPAACESWLALVADRYRGRLSNNLYSEEPTSLSLELAAVEGDYAQFLQRSEETRRVFDAQAAFNRARAGAYAADLLLAYVDDVAAPLALASQLDELADTLEGARLLKTLPAWIANASLADLKLYTANLKRLRISLAMPMEYLYGVESANDYATEQLWTALNLDFPGDNIDPSQVRIRVAQRFATGLHINAASAGVMTSAGLSYPSLQMSLVEYSLQHAIAVPGFPIEISMPDGSTLPATLTPAYVMRIVTELDTGGRYLQRLERTFKPGDQEYQQRLSLFQQQVPATLMDAAIEAKLKGVLSAAAYQIIENVLEMPDSLARQVPPGSHCSIRPLCLLAAKGLNADPVAGLYLLGAAPSAPGPLVLMATYNKAFVFREYRDDQDFMEKMRADGDLKSLVLERLEPAMIARYDHGGLTVANLSASVGPAFEHPLPRPEQTSITYQPVAGNTFTYLFDASLKFLLRQARAQIVTSAQADHAANKHLLALLLEMGLTFVNGRVALVMSLWQSADWVKSSVSAAIAQDWGRAVSQLGAALMIVMTQKYPRRTRLGTAASTVEYASEPLPEYVSRFSDIPVDIRARLRTLEARNITLASLRKDATPGVFIDVVTNRRYCPVAGMVYEVRKLEGIWTIVSEQREGPTLRRNAHGQLEMALAQGLRGGGVAWSAQRREQKIQREVAVAFITEASGMQELRHIYPRRAARLAAAQNRAKQYLRDCIDALAVPPGRLEIALTSKDILKDFLDVTAPSTALISQVKNLAEGILRELLHPSLNMYSSSRYVSGMNKPGYEWVIAFVYRKDAQRRIFLTDGFFDIPLVLRATLRGSQRRFKVGEHFRATSLIHELSHLACDTRDITYLEASAPYLDMIDATRPHGTALVAAITQARNQSLNAHTPQAQLFSVLDNGVRRDMTADDGDGYQQILRLSHTKNLQDARAAFVGDEVIRQNILLANADSVALLITLLARRPAQKP